MSDSYSAFVFKEKRKWQIALRRYILQGYGSYTYAPYFGIDAINFRKWIELQFKEAINWDNFSSSWQFDHIIPVAYFDLKGEEDLKLCWNFTNIRVESGNSNKTRGNRVDVITAKKYFEDLYLKTNYSICKKMLDKLNAIEISIIETTEPLENFIANNNEYLEKIKDFTVEDYNQLNNGKSFSDIVLEKELFKKFG